MARHLDRQKHPCVSNERPTRALRVTSTAPARLEAGAARTNTNRSTPHSRTMTHRSGPVRPANRFTFGFSLLHLAGLRRRMEGLL
jgi:hypothetical protein